MKKTLTVLVVIVVAIAAIWGLMELYKRYNTKLDAEGFPSNPKSGDLFTKDGKEYKFVIDEWVLTSTLRLVDTYKANARTSSPEVMKAEINRILNSDPNNVGRAKRYYCCSKGLFGGCYSRFEDCRNCLDCSEGGGKKE